MRHVKASVLYIVSSPLYGEGSVKEVDSQWSLGIYPTSTIVIW